MTEKDLNKEEEEVVVVVEADVTQEDKGEEKEWTFQFVRHHYRYEAKWSFF